jgi:hypothetical protein
VRVIQRLAAFDFTTHQVRGGEGEDVAAGRASRFAVFANT